MQAEQEYYQISGFQAHSNGWFQKYDDQPMIKKIMESRLFRPRGQGSPVELVLGILPSGASYLLITRDDLYRFTHQHRLCRSEREREPWKASQFLSLSPIHFSDARELSAKIAAYKQRPRNKNRREFEAPKDNSQANRGYVQAGATTVHYRGYFEQQRTLYRLLAENLDPGKVGLAPLSWLGGGVRIVSLVFGEWSVDDRRREERLNSPLLVDAGWTDAQLPPFFDSLTGATVHVKLGSSTRMNNPRAKNPYFSEVVEDDQAGLCQRLRDLLNHDASQSGIPLIVLVHDEDMARGVLLRAGIDLDSWSSGLSNLLPIVARVKSQCKVEDTPCSAVLPGPSIVDMQKLVRAVMETNPGHTIPHSAKVLHMQTDTRTCAGDDSLLLLHMWMSMAQGLAIDEQRKQRAAHQPTCAQVLTPPPRAGNADADPNDADPNDVDLNDVDPNDADPNDMPPGRRPTKEDDFSSDDDW